MPRIAGANSEFTMSSQRACGYRWSDDVVCSSTGVHVCWRSSPEHRSHICVCEAIELRTAAGEPITVIAS